MTRGIIEIVRGLIYGKPLNNAGWHLSDVIRPTVLLYIHLSHKGIVQIDILKQNAAHGMRHTEQSPSGPYYFDRFCSSYLN